MIFKISGGFSKYWWHFVVIVSAGAAVGVLDLVLESVLVLVLDLVLDSVLELVLDLVLEMMMELVQYLVLELDLGFSVGKIDIDVTFLVNSAEYAGV